MIENIKGKIVSEITSTKIDRKEYFCTSAVIDAKGFEILVKGVGKLNTPVTQKQAKSLIDVAKLAPFGLGEKTIVDTRVRNVWKIQKNKIEISKSSYDDYIKPLLDKFKSALGLHQEGVLKAEFHDFLIYEKDQFFSSHQDSEKSDQMIGTLSILLPSKFTGGNLNIKQNGEQKVFTSKNVSNSKKMEVIAFYADCFHEVTEVTSGYRIALTYNLIYKAPKKLSLAVVNDKLTASLKEYFALNATREKEGALGGKTHPQWLIFLLDHQYTQKALSWNMLKGIDLSYVSQLRASADELNLEVSLVLANIRETWSAEEQGYDDWDYHRRSYRHAEANQEDVELGELIDDEYSLEHWIDNNGKSIKANSPNPPHEMYCWAKGNDDLEPMESEYEGYMGNYGNTLDRWYRRAAVVLWPKSKSLESLLILNPISALVKINSMLINDYENGKKALENSLYLWKRISSLDDSNLMPLFEIAINLKDSNLATQVIKNLNLKILETNLISMISKLASTYGEVWLLDLLNIWSSQSCYPKELTNLTRIIKKLVNYDQVVSWLLNYQINSLIEMDRYSESSSSSFSIKKAENSKFKQAIDFLRASTATKNKVCFEKILNHILGCQRVYSSEILAKIVLELKKLNLLKYTKLDLMPIVCERIENELIRVDPKINGRAILEVVPCDCKDCAELKLFLIDPVKKILIWPLAKERRRHIHTILDGMCIGVRHTTERKGSPHKLHLTKTESHFISSLNKVQRLQHLFEQIS